MNHRNSKLLDHLWGFLSEDRQAMFLDKIEQRSNHVTVAIENVYQPHNASAVLRSADCFGLTDVHIIENDNEYVLNPNVTMGSAKWLNIHRYNKQDHNTEDALMALKQKGYRIIATSPHGDSTPLAKLEIKQPVALLFGTEISGLSDVAMDMADETMVIPMYGFTESFNISVSAALCLYDISSRMRETDINWQLSEEERMDTLLQWARRSIKKSDEIERRFLDQ